MIEIYLLGTKKVCTNRDVSPSKHYEEILEGLYPQPIKSSRGKNGWGAHEDQLILHAKLRGATEEETRDLVNEIHLSRALTLTQLSDWFRAKIGGAPLTTKTNINQVHPAKKKRNTQGAPMDL